MRSPARLVTGTAAAALTAAALGLAIPSAHADGLGGPERTAATAAPDPADCGSVDTTAEVPCDSGGVAADDPGGVEDGLDPLADPGAGEPEELDGPDPADEPATPDDPAAVSGPSWPQTEEGDTGTGDDAGAVERPGTGTGTRPAPPSETDPGSAKPPVPPGHRPTPAPSPSRPSGHVGTGVGGSAAPDTAQLATGAGLVGAAAVAGVLLLRRSRRAYGTRR
ncbi:MULTISPECIES: hypothetical protein [Streptomyces]|uniref:Gram-positive cocci surface proteins LPxTG domain-containing protein n=1 Tax=Streptomyces glycanivorans TaxID=3033808 RepID=A0ABY9JKJ7_9ACTN|nr:MULTISPECIES: hypothetical protein [unclassified Streptomyces]WLQ66571.1 hypothetical protein P8A20_24670 [Streptomyces sp. Alt3]WSR50679.1 hypothetical protein OG279_24955 [Streptomyces sp. NBC_01201]